VDVSGYLQNLEFKHIGLSVLIHLDAAFISKEKATLIPKNSLKVLLLTLSLLKVFLLPA